MAVWSGLQRLVVIYSALLCGSQVVSQFCRSDRTERGNASGAKCVFPFMYRNVLYSECTTVDNRGVKWCATTSNYDIDEKWGACVCDLTTEETSCSEKTVNGYTCPRPFYYKGRAYYACTAFENNGVLWCSLDKVYNNRWDACATTNCATPACRLDVTDGGTGGGAACAIPFIYNGNSYSTCTDVDNRAVKWCATTANYNIDKKWGRCICDLVTPAPTGILYCRSSPTVLGNAGGSGCVFPFVYRGVSYTQCTVADNNGVKWCATTSDYGRDKRWGNCVCDQTATPAPTVVPLYCRTDQTQGGNGNGRACSLPFLYRSVIYRTCTSVDNRDQPWCATTSNYDVDRQWGACICNQLNTPAPQVSQTPCRTDVTEVGNSGGAPCFFPFVYKQRTYSECTSADNRGVRWCSTTPDYDIDQRWGRCICSDALIPTPAPAPSSGCSLLSTSRGNGNGAPCVIPYVYKGNTYRDCITLDNGNVYWCSVTSNYDINRQWGQCSCSGSAVPTAAPPPGGAVTPTNAPAPPPTACTDRTEDGRACSLPFTFRGVSYTGCINIDNMGTYWCSLTPNYDSDLQWANCRLPVCNVATPAPRPAGTVPVFVGQCRVDVTEAGNANGAACVFPFIYKSVSYRECTLADNPRLWCATTSNYDVSQQWGRCICATTATTTLAPPPNPTPAPNFQTPPAPVPTPSPNNCRVDFTYGGNGGASRCILPFIYLGQAFTSCISINNNNQQWCAVTASYDRDKLWGNCVCSGSGRETPAPQAPLTTPTTPGDQGAFSTATTTTPRPPSEGTTPFRPPDGTTPFECREFTTDNRVCAPTFIYNSVTYRGCTTQDFDTTFWCSLDSVYMGNYGICRRPLRCSGSAPAPNTPAPPPPPPPPPPATPAPSGQCVVFTTNGQCFFPFQYNGIEYSNCTNRDNGNTFWCSLTRDYNTDGRLGFCTDFSRCRG